ncbi:bifunctional oligoribonuclease/PAP phosphatase NrnA [Candidatus Parcubacteria bacterium]|nr:bifunctional oligoribonuclease/PAP phosphatase NrnA [Candidatus Parcubacteria bacterium]
MHNNIYSNIFNKIKSAKNILLVTHDAPDGDALASICAIIELLESLAKKYFAYCYDAPPYQFDFLPHIEKISNNKKQFNFDDFDLIIALDCGSLNRTKLTDEINNKNKNQFIIEFDHHPKLDDYANLELKDPQAAATTEILYHFLKANKIKINKNIANCILTGILTDTANFLYPSTSQQTVEIASEMLAKGANLPQIMENTRRNKSLASMKIWGKAMSRLQINQKYNFAFTVLTLDEITSSGVTEEELEGIAGFISNLHNVKGTLILREQPGNIVKGSLRTSCPQIDVSQLAQALGGGGHSKASGFKIQGKLKQAEERWKII